MIKRNNIVSNIIRVITLFIAVILISFMGDNKVRAEYNFSYENDDGDRVEVTVSGINNNNYVRFPFGYETRGAYVRAKIDTDMSGGPDTWVWLCEDGPDAGCSDNTLGVKKHSMFWFTRNDFTDRQEDGTTRVGVMVAEYLQDYMKKYYPEVAKYNFRHEIQCEFVWCFSVQALADTIVVGKRSDGSLITIGSRMSLSENGRGLVRTGSYNIPSDGGGDLNESIVGFDFKKRMSAAVKYHYGNGNSLNEYLCYSYEDMKNAQRLLAKNFMGDEALASGFASVSTDQSSFWNAWQVVRIEDNVLGECSVCLGFYDVDKMSQAGGYISEGFSQVTYEKNITNQLISGWSKYLGTDYHVYYEGSMSDYPAYQVEYGNSIPSFKDIQTGRRGYDKDNPSHSIGKLSATGDIYYLDKVPDSDGLLVWIPVKKQTRFKLHFYDPEGKNTVFFSDYSTVDAGYFPQGIVLGAIDIENLFGRFISKNSQNVLLSEYEIDWSRAPGYSAEGFFVVRGDDYRISFDYEIAGGEAVHRFSNSVLEKSKPYFYINAKANDSRYTVLWVPICKKKKPTEVYYCYFDSETGETVAIEGKSYRSATPSEAERNKAAVFENIFVPEGYLYSTSKGAGYYGTNVSEFLYNVAGAASNIKVSESNYNAITGKFSVNSIPDNDYVMLCIPVEKKKTAVFSEVYVHFYYLDKGSAKRIGAKGSKIGQVQQKTKRNVLNVTDIVDIPAGYEYKGGSAAIVYGDELAGVVNRIDALASELRLKGSMSGFPPSVNITSAIPECSYICIWIPVEKSVEHTTVSVQFIDANTGTNIGSMVTVSSVSRNTVFSPLNYKNECLSGVEVEGSYAVDLNGIYCARALSSETADISAASYFETDQYDCLSFVNPALCRVIIPDTVGELLTVKIFVPLSFKAVTKDKDRAVRIVYYNVDSEQHEIIKIDGDYLIPAINTWYIPGRIEDNIIHNGKRYNRSVSDTYVYYSINEGYLGTKFVNRDLLNPGDMVNREDGHFQITKTASEYILYIGMSEGRTSIYSAYIDNNTGEIIKVSTDEKLINNSLCLFEFNPELILEYGGKNYRPCTKKQEARSVYGVRAIYPSFEISMFPEYNWPETRLSYYGEKQFFALEASECYMFGVSGSVLINIGGKNISKLYLFIPCEEVRKTEIHCVSENSPEGTSFLRSYTLYTSVGETVSQKLEEITYEDKVYLPLEKGSFAIIQEDICDGRPEGIEEGKRYRYCERCYGTGKAGVSYCSVCTAGGKNLDNSQSYTLYIKHKNYYSSDGLSEGEADWVYSNVHWRPGLVLSSGSLRQCESCGSWNNVYTYSSYHGKSYYYTAFSSYGYYRNDNEKMCSACEGTGYELVEVFSGALCNKCGKVYYTPGKHLVSKSVDSRYLSSNECMLMSDIKSVCNSYIFKTLSYNQAISSEYKRIGAAVECQGSSYCAVTSEAGAPYGHTVMYVLYGCEEPKVTVRYVTTDEDGDIKNIVKECEGGRVTRNQKYEYYGESELLADGKRYMVTGMNALLVYGENIYEDVRDYCKPEAGQKVIYSGEGSWISEQIYSSDRNAILYIPVKRADIPTEVLYITVNENGGLARIIKAERGPVVTPGDFYSYKGYTYIEDEQGVVYGLSSKLSPVICYGDKNLYNIIDRKIPDERWQRVTRIDRNKWKSQEVIPEINELTLFIPVIPEEVNSFVSVSKRDNIVVNYNDTTADAMIYAQEGSGFDVNKAIPSSEYIFSEVKANVYTLAASFKNITGIREYIVTVEQPYDIIDRESGNTGTITKSRKVLVKRAYSYWIIDYVKYYRLSDASICNAAVTDNGRSDCMKIDFSKNMSTDKEAKYHLPVIKCDKLAEEENSHLLEPTINKVVLPTIEIYNASASVTVEDLSVHIAALAAEKAVREIKVKNDGMSFDDANIMSSEWCDRQSSEPLIAGILFPGQVVGRSEDILIPNRTRNAEYESTGSVHYIPMTLVNSLPDEGRYNIDGINSVKIHTPIAIGLLIIDDNLKYVQYLNSTTADKMSHIVLGRTAVAGGNEYNNTTNDFAVEYSFKGSHLDENVFPGYGSRDYSKYIDLIDGRPDISISFSCDVIADVQGDRNTENDIILKAGTWNSVYQSYYVPEWVQEGIYKATIRAAAINSLPEDLEEQCVNLNISSYYVYDEYSIEVSGKMFGLTLNSVNSNAYDWRDVFYSNSKLKSRYLLNYSDGTYSNSFDNSRLYYYTSGVNNETGILTGRLKKYTLPLVKGSSPVSKDYGLLKSGYVWNFSLKTIGSKTSDDMSYISITPSFYSVSLDGKSRERVDLWYEAEIKGKKYNYVRAGSKTDLLKKNYSYALSDSMGIPVDLLETNARLIGGSELLKKNTVTYSYGQIVIDKSYKMFSGTKYAEDMRLKDSGYSYLQLTSLEQTWYFQYGLPNMYHICKYGTPVESYLEKNGVCTYEEPYWIKEGYLIVHFDIEAYDKNGKKIMTYTNSGNNILNGMCDMWRLEGYQNKKTDSSGALFNFEGGDVAIVYIPGSTTEKGSTTPDPPTNYSEDRVVDHLN